MLIWGNRSRFLYMLPLLPWCFIGPQEPLTARKLKPTFVLLPFTTRHKADSGSVACGSYLRPFLALYYTFLDCSHRCAIVLGGRAGWWSVVFHSVQMLYTKWQSHEQLCSLTFWTSGMSVYQTGATCEKKPLLNLERDSFTSLESSLRSSCPGRGSPSSSLCMHTRTHAHRSIDILVQSWAVHIGRVQ